VEDLPSNASNDLPPSDDFNEDAEVLTATGLLFPSEAVPVVDVVEVVDVADVVEVVEGVSSRREGERDIALEEPAGDRRGRV
jgi:hypothetical protein